MNKKLEFLLAKRIGMHNFKFVYDKKRRSWIITSPNMSSQITGTCAVYVAYDIGNGVFDWLKDYK